MASRHVTASGFLGRVLQHNEAARQGTVHTKAAKRLSPSAQAERVQQWIFMVAGLRNGRLWLQAEFNRLISNIRFYCEGSASLEASCQILCTASH
jgi:hypothetical protein